MSPIPAHEIAGGAGTHVSVRTDRSLFCSCIDASMRGGLRAVVVTLGLRAGLQRCRMRGWTAWVHGCVGASVQQPIFASLTRIPHHDGRLTTRQARQDGYIDRRQLGNTFYRQVQLWMECPGLRRTFLCQRLRCRCQTVCPQLYGRRGRRRMVPAACQGPGQAQMLLTEHNHRLGELNDQYPLSSLRNAHVPRRLRFSGQKPLYPSAQSTMIECKKIY